MELSVHISSSFGSLFPNYSALSPYGEIKFGFQGRSSSITCRNSKHQSLVLSEKEVQQQQLWSSQREMDLDDDDEMEFDDASSFLSLSEKPDRNMALLDDYEIEEIDYASHPSHKSGEFQLLSFSFSIKKQTPYELIYRINCRICGSTWEAKCGEEYAREPNDWSEALNCYK